jgi:hypothetical protein
MAHQKHRGDQQADMKDKHQDGETGVKPPAAGTEGYQPVEDGAQGAFDAVAHVLRIGHAVHLPVQAPDVPHQTIEQAEDKDAEGDPGKGAGYQFIHGLLLF